MASKAAEIKAGSVVLVGLIIFGFGAFMVSGGSDLFRAKNTYTVHFQRVGGLKNGDEVMVSGRDVGEVLSIEPEQIEIDGEARKRLHEQSVLSDQAWKTEGPLDMLTVVFEVREDAVIHLNSDITISQTVTGIKSMNISTGTGERADKGSRLYGRRMATLEETIDDAKKLIADARKAVAGIDVAIGDARVIVREFRDRKLADQVEKILQTTQSAVSKVETLIDDGRPGVLEAIDNLDAALKSAKDLVQDVEKQWGDEYKAKVQAIVANVERATAELKAAVEENRPNVKAIIENVHDASELITPMIVKIDHLAENADDAITEVRPRLVATMESAKRAMRGFDAVVEDLKTAPWKLVNKPSGTEVREVHLYNAARLYTTAVGDVADAVDNLEVLQGTGAFEEQERREDIEAALQRLQEALKDFDRREKELVEIIQQAR